MTSITTSGWESIGTWLLATSVTVGPNAVTEDELAAGRLNVVLPEIPMSTAPIYVLHAFGRQLPLRARLFIDFLVEALGVSADASL